MEFVGPQPVYCAIHIALDPSAFYHQCDFVDGRGQQVGDQHTHHQTHIVFTNNSFFSSFFVIQQIYLIN
jgi:hypothetical protein